MTALLIALLFGVQDARADAFDQPRWLIEAPTAGLLPSRGVSFDLLFFGGDGILAETAIGVADRVFLGLSFGGQRLTGASGPIWNPRPEANVRVRILEETARRPSLAVGFRTQGFGGYDEALGRYETKSLGLYAVFSRNYRNPLGEGGVHFGVNRSLEDSDGDGDLTGYVGVNLDVGRRVSLATEYHFGWNDDGDGAQGTGRGYLNAALRWKVGGRLAIETALKNVLETAGAENFGRQVRVIYTTAM